jgi:hypothetical protein
MELLEEQYWDTKRARSLVFMEVLEELVLFVVDIRISFEQSKRETENKHPDNHQNKNEVFPVESCRPIDHPLFSEELIIIFEATHVKKSRLLTRRCEADTELWIF